ncbi:YceD family protein [Bosea sp. (in: a-proteobacteria)]
MTLDHPGAAPFRHPVRVETIRQRGTEIVLEADPAQRAAIAAALGLPSVEALTARYLATRNGDRVKLEGRIEAHLHQSCVVTLEPFPAKLDVPVKLDFAPQEDPQAVPRRGSDVAGIDIEVLLNEDDPPEPIVDGVIDLGTITLEFLALSLDPYPRKPGVSFEQPAPPAEEVSPFAALAKLKRDAT